MTIRKRWAAALAVVLASALAVAGVSAASAADPTFTRASFSTNTNWTWVNDSNMGNTSGAAQYAQATLSGTFDKDHAAGFRLRYSASSNILLAVSATEWKTEPSAGTVVNGPKSLTVPGLLRVEIDASNNARIFWNGVQIGSRAIPGTYSGTGIVPSIWQSSPGLKMTNLEAGTLGTTPTPTTSTTSTPGPTATITVTPTVTAPPVTSTAPAVTVTPGVPTVTVTAPAVTVTPTVVVTPTVTATPTTTPTTPSPTTESPSTSPTSPSPTTESPTPSPSTTTPTTTPPEPARWLSGASSVYAVNGSYGSWRGEPVKIVGTWSDGDPGGSQSIGSMGPGTDMENLNSSFSLDIAIGAIWNGQTWAQAATGAYNNGWLTTLNTLKTKLAQVGVKPENTYIRFAHEYNGDWFDWKVAKGQEANFRNAIARFSSLRYQVFGETNAPKVVLCSNEGTSGGMADPRDEFVKNDGLGRPVVDVYCTDFYNAWPWRTDSTQLRNWLNRVDGGIPDSPEEHRRFAESVGVPFSVGEWSNCGVASQCADGGGESPNFMVEINRWFREHAGSLSNPQPGQLLYEVQFNLWSQYAIYGPEGHQPVTAAKYAEQVWGQ